MNFFPGFADVNSERLLVTSAKSFGLLNSKNCFKNKFKKSKLKCRATVTQKAKMCILSITLETLSGLIVDNWTKL